MSFSQAVAAFFNDPLSRAGLIAQAFLAAILFGFGLVLTVISGTARSFMDRLGVGRFSAIGVGLGIALMVVATMLTAMLVFNLALASFRTPHSPGYRFALSPAFGFVLPVIAYALFRLKRLDLAWYGTLEISVAAAAAWTMAFTPAPSLVARLVAGATVTYFLVRGFDNFSAGSGWARLVAFEKGRRSARRRSRHNRRSPPTT